MTNAPTIFYMRRIGFMTLIGSAVLNLAILAAILAVFGTLAPIVPADSITTAMGN